MLIRYHRGRSNAVVIVAALVLAAACRPAGAVDLPQVVTNVPPPITKVASVTTYDWTGPYVGVNVGLGFNTSNLTVDSHSIRPNGLHVGGTLGYNRQSGSIVYGLETDLAIATSSHSLICSPNTRPPPPIVCETKNRMLGTVRGRAGYAFDRWLPYLTAGVGYGYLQATSTDPTVPPANAFKAGWTAGLGVEYAFLGSWSLKLEYLYVCLGRVAGGLTCSTQVGPTNPSIKHSLVRAGLNYRF
jgi:outer membrane immunogenic protein